MKEKNQLKITDMQVMGKKIRTGCSNKRWSVTETEVTVKEAQHSPWMQRQIPNKYHRWRKKESRSTWKGHINAKIPSMGKWKEWISHSTMPPSESLLSVGKKKTNNQVNRFLFLEQSLLQSVVTYTKTTCGSERILKINENMWMTVI